jgi:hypothetical protein
MVGNLDFPHLSACRTSPLEENTGSREHSVDEMKVVLIFLIVHWSSRVGCTVCVNLLGFQYLMDRPGMLVLSVFRDRGSGLGLQEHFRGQ